MRGINEKTCFLFVIPSFYTYAIRHQMQLMKKVKISAVRKVQYDDLMAEYENPIEHSCDVVEGQTWISVDGQRPPGLCPEAWKTMSEFVPSASTLKHLKSEAPVSEQRPGVGCIAQEQNQTGQA